MDHFELVSEYKPTGDQPQAIDALVRGFQESSQCETRNFSRTMRWSISSPSVPGPEHGE